MGIIGTDLRNSGKANNGRLPRSGTVTKLDERVCAGGLYHSMRELSRIWGYFLYCMGNQTNLHRLMRCASG